jgi:hypothetical protein
MDIYFTCGLVRKAHCSYAVAVCDATKDECGSNEGYINIYRRQTSSVENLLSNYPARFCHFNCVRLNQNLVDAIKFYFSGVMQTVENAKAAFGI